MKALKIYAGERYGRCRRLRDRLVFFRPAVLLPLLTVRCDDLWPQLDGRRLLLRFLDCFLLFFLCCFDAVALNALSTSGAVAAAAAAAAVAAAEDDDDARMGTLAPSPQPPPPLVRLVR